ncbi:MAG: site-2 protease family protein [Carboxydocellales bacterium]|jgi:Zn-dependent protease
MFDIYNLAAIIPAMVIGLTLHEYAHAKVADMLGDSTAKMLGRVTLDPLKHLDPLGTILLFVVGFGWAKPVPITPSNIRGNQRLGEIWISLAGPAANLVIAFGSLLIYNWFASDLGTIGQTIIRKMVQLNILLAALNLLPIPPLDGSSLLVNLWKRPPGWVSFLQNNGMVVLILLMLSGGLGIILGPVMSVFYTILSTLANIIS